jgi:hypothetical protein
MRRAIQPGLLSGVKQKSHFKGVRTVFDLKAAEPACAFSLQQFHIVVVAAAEVSSGVCAKPTEG